MVPAEIRPARNRRVDAADVGSAHERWGLVAGLLPLFLLGLGLAGNSLQETHSLLVVCSL